MKPLILLMLLLSTSAIGHPGRTDADRCHAGSQPHHCHEKKRNISADKDEIVCIYIYRKDGRPVYIGISNNPERRWRQHADDGRPFANLPKSIESCHNSRREALKVERDLIIRHCNPALLNKTHCHR